jgi:hypothetical protein
MLHLYHHHGTEVPNALPQIALKQVLYEEFDRKSVIFVPDPTHAVAFQKHRH